jgi:hypothetical protein
MFCRLVASCVGTALLLTAAEVTRRVCRRKYDSLLELGITEDLRKKRERELDRLHVVSMILSCVSLTPLLLIPPILEIARYRVLEGGAVAGLVAVLFWVGKHFEMEWIRPWITEPLTPSRSITLAFTGLIVVSCVFVIASDQNARKTAIEKIKHNFKSDDKHD